MKKIILISSGAIVALIGIIILVMMFSYKNDEVRLKNEFQAQSQKIEAVHDNMWKIIQQKGMNKPNILTIKNQKHL